MEGMETFLLFNHLLLRSYWRIRNVRNRPAPFPILPSCPVFLLCLLSRPPPAPPPPSFTSHSDQCLHLRSWLNSDETLWPLLTNHTWKPIPLHLHILLSGLILLQIFYPHAFTFFSVTPTPLCMRQEVSSRDAEGRERWLTWTDRPDHGQTGGFWKC